MFYTHDQHTAKALGIVAIVCVIVFTLAGCTPNEYPDSNAPHETEQEMNAQITKEMEKMDSENNVLDNSGPSDFTGIADALGCVFAPNDCVLKKRKEEQQLDR